MSEENHAASNEKLALTANIVAAFVANNAISAGDLPGLIDSVFAALGGLGQPVAVPAME